MLQADAGPFNGGATLFATQIPLYSTCISKSTSSAHSPNPTHSANSTHSTNSTHSANSTISSGSAHSALSTPFGFKNSTNSTRPTRNMRLFPSITPAL
ncbi:hypothetical protein EV356DRAFT_502575 [Viridothelium virens]|uniref:Uncharacterized protein n=1 Tax=Viridothelium virens TaxID=1048519 RepID=A0A6A6H8S3_VIRVR|nr:hypothetical protein EV356DRAFT_502575 [Viridothelium virens]